MTFSLSGLLLVWRENRALRDGTWITECFILYDDMHLCHDLKQDLNYFWPQFKNKVQKKTKKKTYKANLRLNMQIYLHEDVVRSGNKDKFN